MATGDNAKGGVGAALDRLVRELEAARDPAGFWPGRLSSSALATAAATVALRTAGTADDRAALERAEAWLCRHVNDDGGWGDSPESPSNRTATLLVWCALGMAGSAPAPRRRAALEAAETWLRRELGALTADAIRAGLANRYGDDRTFQAPVLTLCAIAGRLGPDAWRAVPQLPFELCLLPRTLFRYLRLEVVSYALPALIAIGIVRHRRRPGGGFLRRRLRELAVPRLLAMAGAVQPPNGGYEEAVPLTAFVIMALAAAGYGGDPAVRGGLSYLRATVRPDGSWPICTGLGVWLTTLAVNGAHGAAAGRLLEAGGAERLRQWLLARQQRGPHPLIGGGAGGWPWGERPGAMPDADDTAGALLALRRLGPADGDARRAAERALDWLLSLQNGDGGMPTFCRGWGRLPFDRSCPDISAHALAAMTAWQDDLGRLRRVRVRRAARRLHVYLERAQAPDGTWCALWFGSQAAPDEENRVFSTARVVWALRDDARTAARAAGMLERAEQWLVTAQHADGGWGADAGGPVGIETTGAAVAALAGTGHGEAVRRGAAWLAARAAGGDALPAAPIGLYFARLWYSERLYPVVFSLAGLSRADNLVELDDAKT